MLIDVREKPFDPWEELRRYQDNNMATREGAYGATATFVGTVRDLNEGEPVRNIMLEHYPGMTENYLQKIVQEAGRQWDILDSLILHRVGQLHPGEPIVLVAVWSEHRAAAFAACRYLIEELKSRAPFWKKESLPQEMRWVTHNTPAV